VQTVIRNRLKKENGFTLIELLIAMALALIIMAAIYCTYYSQQKSYMVQEQVASMQQNLRAAMFYMEREIRMAGCDPTRKTDAGISTARANMIAFTEDTDGDEVLKGITYTLYVDTEGVQKLGRTVVAGNTPVAEYIDRLNFVYLDKDGNDLADDGAGNVTTPANIDRIRSVEVTVVARTGIEDRGYIDTDAYYNQRGDEILPAQNDHYRRKLLSTHIRCRNLGI
jgi:type IV pilus assembly protein PilW